jgi:small subunit ribosomal protein S4
VKVDIPSYTVKKGEVISVIPTSRDAELFKVVREGSARIQPKWLSCNFDELKVTVETLPERSDVDFALQEKMIIEFYSR